MNWETAAIVSTLAVGGILLAMHLIALIAGCRAKGRYAKNFQSITVHIAFVTGLTIFQYVWILGSEDQRIRWLSYSLCSPVLILTFFEYTTRHDPRKPYPPLLWLTVVATFVSVVSGFFIAVNGLDPTIRYIAFAGAFVPFIAIPFLLSAAIKEASHGVAGISTIGGFFGFFWIGYPVVYILSPVVLGSITVAQSVVFYVLTDLVTKVVFKIYYGSRAYRLWLCMDEIRDWQQFEALDGRKTKHKKKHHHHRRRRTMKLSNDDDESCSESSSESPSDVA